VIASLRAPGLLRAGLWLLIGIAFSWLLLFLANGLDAGRADGEALLRVSMIAAPLFALVGLGAFDYWFYWASGRKTRPEDHSNHGAKSWHDYFKINTDHKVIGIQYTVTSFFFLMVGGLLAMLMRAELAQPGRQFVDANAYNGLFSVHAVDPDLPVHHPGLRRAGELRACR
jgi:cytochrome c oxidase subunit 1